MSDATTDTAPAADDTDTDTDTDTGSHPEDVGSTATPRDRHLGPVIALGLAAAVAIAAVVVSLVGGDDVSPTAIRVDGHEVSQKTFNSELRSLSSALASQQGAEASGTVTDAFLPSSATAQLATLYVNTQLLDDALARSDVDVSAADRRDFVASNRKELSGYSESTSNLIVDNNLFQQALVGALGQDQAATTFQRLARRADVHVDSRYGFWNPARAEVCPPVGCAAPSQPGG